MYQTFLNNVKSLIHLARKKLCLFALSFKVIECIKIKHSNIMSTMILVEKQQFDTLLNKVDQIYDAMFKTEQKQKINKINGMISEEDACKLFGKSKTWFWRKRKGGDIPHMKMGSTVFYLKDDLFNLFEDVTS